MLDSMILTNISIYGLALLMMKAVVVLVIARAVTDSLAYNSSGLRFSVWLLSIIILAVIPLLTFLLPPWYAFEIDLSSAHSVVQDGQASSLTFANALLGAYFVVMLARLMYLAYQLLRTAWITAIAKEDKDAWSAYKPWHDKRIKIKRTEKIQSAFTWGWIRPVILLPKNAISWSDAEKIMVLQHEFTHVKRMDWLAQLLAQLVAILYWPVPGIGAALQEMSLEAERACDDEVLRLGAEPADYAGLLVRHARQNVLQAGVALAKSSELADRVKHIINAYVDRAGEQGAIRIFTVAALVIALPLSSVNALGVIHSENVISGMTVFPIVAYKVEKKEPEKEDNFSRYEKPVRPMAIERPPTWSPVVTNRSDLPAIEKALIHPDVENKEVSEIRISREDVQAVPIEHVKPKYPVYALRRGIEGRVLIGFDITEKGSIQNPKVIESSPPGVFDKAVIKALEKNKFKPASSYQQPISIKGVQQEYIFRVEGIDTARPITIGDERAGS
ncbi:MAG: TonB family protein [Rickettsiales bacterium]